MIKPVRAGFRNILLDTCADLGEGVVGAPPHLSLENWNLLNSQISITKNSPPPSSIGKQKYPLNLNGEIFLDPCMDFESEEP